MVERSRSKMGAEAFAVSPFNRLARTHGLSVAGDALLAVALADSLFFNVDPNDARWRVAAYLVLTIAPFAVVAPFLGPLMDQLKGGHRLLMIGAAAVRAIVMLALVRYVQGPLLFPLAFTMLVMTKTHAVAKSALVPSTVRDTEELVRSNARLSVLAGVASGVAGVPGVILLQFGGSPSVLVLGGLVFATGVVFATQIPPIKVAPDREEPEERRELRSSGIVLAASAMGFLRMVAGFITLLLAFELRGGIDPGPSEPGVEVGHRVREALGLERLDLATGGAPAWHFGVAVVGVGAGGLIAALGVPRLRAHLREERILAFALFVLAGLAGLAFIATDLVGAFLVGMAVALSGTAGKQAFDAIVQRDAPTANLGRSFSRFESRFQLLWVVGALIPVVLPVPAPIGYLLVACAAGFVGLSYWFGRTPDPRAVLADQNLAAGVRRRLRWTVARAGGDPGPSAAAARADDGPVDDDPAVDDEQATAIDADPTTELVAAGGDDATTELSEQGAEPDGGRR